MVSPSSLDSFLQSPYTYKAFLFESDFQNLCPEIFLTLSLLACLVYGVIFSGMASKNYPMLGANITWLTLFSFLLTGALILNNPIHHALLLYSTFIVDDFGGFLKILILGSSFFSLYMALHYTAEETLNAFESSVLIGFSTLSMLFLVSSADFLSMYLAIELQSLCFYVLAAMKRNSEFSTEAGLKYFLLGAFSSGLLLFGCSLIYGFTGMTNFAEIAKIFSGETQDILFTTSSLPVCELGLVFLLVGFFFKIAAAPFHMWSPDVYEGAPTSITAFFMITPKAAFFGVFLRMFLESFYEFFASWQIFLIGASLTSLVVGSVAALAQTKLKRLLAFSSIGHVGYLLAGFACGTVEGIQALLIYLVIYIVMNINIFAFLLCSLRRDGNYACSRMKYITDLTYLSKTQPILALTFTFTMFSMAGIPPLAGFYSKAYLFFATMSSNLYSLAIVGVLMSVLSCFYYIRLVKIMYFEVPTQWCSWNQVPKENALTLGITLFFLVFFLIYPAPLHLATHEISLVLCS